MHTIAVRCSKNNVHVGELEQIGTFLRGISLEIGTSQFLGHVATFETFGSLRPSRDEDRGVPSEKLGPCPPFHRGLRMPFGLT